jgi:hypothetical protein
MAQVTVNAERTIDAPADKVSEALADYRDTREKMLTEQFSNYRVLEGGTGAGTVVGWKLQATKKRVRDCEFAVEQSPEGALVERDKNSSMVTTWTVKPAGEKSTVTVQTVWNGAGGIGGFFEKTFAPLGMRKIYDAQLEKLAALV